MRIGRAYPDAEEGAVETSSFRLGRIGGVPVGASWSLLVVALVLGTGLAQSRFPLTHTGYSAGAYWIAALVTVLAFFGSILAHEMGHALVARARGLEVDGVTLWFLGGVTRMHGEIDGPGTDAGIAAIGPVTSGLLGLAFAGVATLGSDMGIDPLAIAPLEWLAVINLALAAFNAIPAAPLDGGSVLAAIVWWRTGDRTGGRRVAANAGMLFGGGLLAYGLWSLLGDAPDAGIWTLLVGWFVLQAARSELATLGPRGSASSVDAAERASVTIGQIAPHHPPVVAESATVDDLIGMLDSIGSHTAFAVRDSAGVLSSAVLVESLKSVPPAERATATARGLAIDLASQLTAWVDESPDEVLRRRTDPSGLQVVAVYDPHMTLVSLVTRIDMARFATARRQMVGGTEQ